MKIAIALVCVAGVAIGFALPTKKHAPAPAVAAAAPGTPAPPVETVLDRASNGHFLAVANVNDEPIRFVVDTGADIVALTEEDARRAHVRFDPSQYEVVGRGAAGLVRGQEIRIAEIELDGKRASDVQAVILADGEMSLLGQTFLRKLKEVRITGDQMRIS
ncbi:retropepsin-like aspartic protease family protein [Sphingomonas immobilis]|uniref:TIGR02281 family clan AA aspartic protease n=1 Tax=Sphingomonas immobilis TaxID=3063997 RepID=A0ABT9A275_9SPHN|nr:TIGR02281 family clan AA aspartic protease [Sphingomonas sp. CA1-15]MDO7843942.1 TIGR02281 family clan AA aspartic protease [Sphingomonas sp. CA1-15]